MSQNNFVPERRQSSGTPERAPAITPLPARADPGMSRKQQQRLFEQVKAQVADVANRHFDQTLRIIRGWMVNDISK